MLIHCDSDSDSGSAISLWTKMSITNQVLNQI